MKTPILAAALAALPLASCAIIPDAPNVEGTQWPAGYAVPLLQPVEVGEVVVTPRSVVEDSRCPVDAQCVWQGRLVVRTRIDGAGWRDTADIALGETFGTHGHVIALVAAEPGTRQGSEIPERDYRFTYESR